MKKQFLFLLIALGIFLFTSCNSKTNKKETQNESLSTVETGKSVEQNDNNSSHKLSFNFNGESFENDPTLPNELKGIRTDGDNWIIIFSGSGSDKYKQVSIQFDLEDFKLTNGKVKIKNCTIVLMDFKDIDAGDAALFSNESIYLEVTTLEKISTESNMGTSIDKYNISGKFHGDFRNLTGTKIFKVENGTFENYTLVDIK